MIKFLLGLRIDHLFDHSIAANIQALAALFALVSAWAWAKSALDQIWPDRNNGWIDRCLNRISNNHVVWNAIAASFAALAAMMQATVYLATIPK